jgi:hypothetical protein
MSDRAAIDIMQEFVDLYGKEEMLAFFDFSVERPGREPISGLCRISRPKGGGRMQYMSLTFVADTPDDAARQAIAALLQRIDADNLRRAVPQVSEVVTMPSIGTDPSSYVTQVDILLDSVPDKQFIALRLLPAVRRLMQVKPTEVVWWADPDKAAPVAAPTRETGGSLVGDLKGYLSRHFRTDKG